MGKKTISLVKSVNRAMLGIILRKINIFTFIYLRK